MNKGSFVGWVTGVGPEQDIDSAIA